MNVYCGCEASVKLSRVDEIDDLVSQRKNQLTSQPCLNILLAFDSSSYITTSKEKCTHYNGKKVLVMHYYNNTTATPIEL